jgi:signal transduction histidine kinase
MENNMKSGSAQSPRMTTSIREDKLYSFSSSNLGSASELEHMEAELRLTLEEVARLQNSLAEANMKNTALQASLENQAPTVESKQALKPIIQELNQPLHTIQGYLDLLSNESVGILEELLKNLELDADETDNDSRIYTKEFSLTTVVEETLALYTELIRNKLIILKVEFENEDISFVGDKESFERVLNILFTNSFTSVQDEGTITLGLKILRGKKPAQVLISVQTNDHDSPKAKPLPVKLEEFKDPEIKLEGFGSLLKDLFKAKQIVEEMHGKMEIFSIPSSGSLIRVKLPVSQ